MVNTEPKKTLHTDPIINAIKDSGKRVVAIRGFIEVEKKVVRLYPRPSSSVCMEFDLNSVVRFISPEHEGKPTVLYIPEDTQLRFLASGTLSAAELRMASASMKSNGSSTCCSNSRSHALSL
jgi:hypothetical protein